jgi:hypothetical protein
MKAAKRQRLLKGKQKIDFYKLNEILGKHKTRTAHNIMCFPN